MQQGCGKIKAKLEKKNWRAKYGLESQLKVKIWRKKHIT